MKHLGTGSFILWYLPEAKQGAFSDLSRAKTRFYLAFKIPDRTAKSMFSAIEQLCRLFPKEALKTFTSDREKEFACYPLVENLEFPFSLRMPIHPGREEAMKTQMAY